MEPSARSAKALATAIALVLALAAIFAAPGSAAAHAAPSVTDGGVQNDFPAGMVFSVSAESAVDIEQIRLRYSVLPDGTAAIGHTEFEPSTFVSTTFELEANLPPRIYLPPGTIIEYTWEVTDAAGNTAATDTARFVYEDIRFDWQALEGDGIVLSYYSGSGSDARRMLEVGEDTMTEVSPLLGAEIRFPVRVWVYDTSSDMQPALPRRSPTFEERITTAGVRVASDTVLVLGNVSFDTLRHELAHIVTAQAGGSAFSRMPAWLDEGTAVYAQERPGGFETAVRRGISNDEVFSVRQISSYQGDPARVSLFYGQSWSLVDHLIDTYGEESFAQLFAELRAGNRIDSALEAIYGFDQNGLDAEWRAANGLPERATPGPAEPSDPAPAPGTGGGGTDVLTVITLVLVTIVLAGMVGLTGLIIARRVG